MARQSFRKKAICRAIIGAKSRLQKSRWPPDIVGSYKMQSRRLLEEPIGVFENKTFQCRYPALFHFFFVCRVLSAVSACRIRAGLIHYSRGAITLYKFCVRFYSPILPTFLTRKEKKNINLFFVFFCPKKRNDMLGREENWPGRLFVTNW